MLSISRYFALVAVASCLLLAQPLAASQETEGNLVTVDWLQKHLHDGNVLILDASPTQIYSKKHVPGAINADVFSYLITYGIGDAPVADAQKVFRAWGVSPTKKIVIYDQGGTMMATRLLYSLDYYGFPPKNLAILDGGLAKWQEKGSPVTADMTPTPKNGSFKIGKLNEGVRARLPEFLTASGDPVNNALVEALGPDWHFGEVRAFGKAGHIPHAVLLPSADFYNADKTFKSAEDIRKMLAYVGIRPEQKIYTHCGGGVAASVPYFALKFIVHYPSVKLYAESEMGWVSDERDLPYWTYDAPSLMRDANWLQFWGGQMIRTYGGTHVSIVDVRPAEAFNQGHVPFALNIPADVFRSNIADPGKLAAILGPAGVDSAHEAVVISGAGLTRESALAFLMLEKLGQKKVSVLMESMDQWAKLGFAVKKDATAVGPQTSARGLTIASTTYPANFRTDVVIGDAKITVGLYPKVFIASGSTFPRAAQDGKVVHVPYTDLLNPDGTPKAAKEIWSILTKAGVPRYAELVCFSDDPGEAAANYFVLKLMGFPDIKVLVI